MDNVFSSARYPNGAKHLKSMMAERPGQLVSQALYEPLIWSWCHLVIHEVKKKKNRMEGNGKKSMMNSTPYGGI